MSAETAVRRVTMPAYLSSFRCLGAACEDNCCRAGWNIPVDASTFLRYRELDHEMGPALRQHIPANAPDKATPEDFARIRLNEHGACPFLTDGMCGVQMTLGEPLLSNVCLSYPRRTNVVDERIERAAMLSCPEIARLALLDPCAMELREVEEPAGTRTVLGAVFDQRVAQQDALLGQASIIRRATVRLLQSRAGSIEARLVGLGLSLTRLSGRGHVAQRVEAVFDLYTEGLPQIDEQLASMPADRELQLEVLREITVERYATGRVLPSQRYDRCIERIARGLRLRRTTSPGAESVAAYDSAVRDVFQPFFAARPHILQNFLVNGVYASSFPFSGGRKPFDDYVLLAVRFALLKMLLVGVAAHQGQLTDELVIETVQPFEQVFTHDPNFLRHVLKLLRRSRAASMPFLTALILS